jgi:hypothetical protein
MAQGERFACPAAAAVHKLSSQFVDLDEPVDLYRRNIAKGPRFLSRGRLTTGGQGGDYDHTHRLWR